MEPVGFRNVFIKFLVILPVIIMAAMMATEGQTAEGGAERFNMSYIYFGNSGIYTGYVDDTKGSLDDISPSYFDLNDDGTLKLTMAVDRRFIREMHERGISVTPFLSNHWDRQKGINALKIREQLASQVAAAIAEYDLDGVNVDIENMTETERDSYTDFVKLLREKLPVGKSVSVAVAPNPYGLTKGWHASYDLAGLSEYSDYLMLMTYDEHYQGDVKSSGGAGPVAGYGFVEDSIKASLKKVPANKLVLGIPFYGRLWKQGASYGGYGISNYMVEQMIRDYNGKVVYDNVRKSPKAVITIAAGDKKPVVFGKALEAGTYDIWFENEASIKEKLELVGKYNLKGTGSWSLGQESKSTWDYYSLWLDSIYFSDIQSHWAKPSILSAMDKGWMNGVSGTQFMPDAPVTRAQAAALLVRVLGIDTSAVRSTVFTDTKEHWAAIEIEAARLKGLVEGIGGGKFGPDNVLTREQIAVMLDRIMKLDTQAAPVFTDVTPENSSWSYEAVNRMAEYGMVDGFPDGTFRPEAAMKRGEISVMIERSYARLAGGPVTAITK